MNPKFKIYTGPMWSSKTTKMLLDLERYRYMDKTIVLFKPDIDNRYSENEVVTHSGWKFAAVKVESAADIVKHLASLSYDPDVIAVDEAFMIDGISDLLIWLYTYDHNIVVSTLEMSFSGKVFKEVEKMMPWATHIEKCTAICTVCKEKARYTYKKNLSDSEIEVGGAEMYEPRCGTHHPSIMKAK